MANKNKPVTGIDDPRIYADFQHLVQFKFMKNSFTLTPYQNSAGLMSGRHLSKFRGRGLNFEEFRHYQEGDDIRAMDWRVTMRTRQPYVRVYSEEKDLPVVLFVDQRKSMFFSSQDTFKSVIAAELSAICAWQVLKDTDRVGCLSFNDKMHTWVSPQRSQKNTLKIIKDIADYNQHLSAKVSIEETPRESLNRALRALQKIQLKGALIIMLSDFKGLDEQAKSQLQALKSANDVLGVIISDPFEHKIDGANEFYATDGAKQVSLTNETGDLAAQFEQHARDERLKLKKLFSAKSAPYIEIDTDGSHVNKFQMKMRER